MSDLSFYGLLGNCDDSESESKWRFLSGEELKEYRKRHQPIKDLKPGDFLMLKEPGLYRFPKIGQVVEVYNVIEKPVMKLALTGGIGDGRDCEIDDFTLIVEKNGRTFEYSFDSRFFDRVSRA